MAETTSVKIALCQIFCLDGDRSGNLARMENALREAKEKNVHIACFPEMAIYGWVNPDARRRAHPIPGEDASRLCALAKAYSLFLCAGLAEKEGENLYDSALLIDDEGKILLKHRKINILTHLMDPPYAKGSEIGAADTKYGRIGMMICADTFEEENLSRMKDLKPDLVLVPYGWAAKEEEWPQHGKSLADTISQAARAISAPLIGTDLVGEITHGPWTGYVYGGQSAAADRSGNILARGRDRDRDIVIVELPIGGK